MGDWLSGALDTVVLGNPLLRWLAALAAAALAFAGLRFLRNTLRVRLGRLAERTRTPVDDMIVDVVSRVRSFFLLVLAARAAAFLLEVPGEVGASLRQVLVVTVLIQVGFWANGLVLFWVARVARTADPDETSRAALVPLLALTGRVVTWTLVVLLALQNLGVEITALLTGLGVGGIAVALALQNILGDLFAALSILLDKPFAVGDFVVVDALSGTVEHVGLKSTRVRSLGGEQLVIANSDLLKSRIRNYKRMTERRVLFGIGVTYQTPHAQLVRIPGILREIVESTPDTRFDRAHFKSFGDSALVFEVVFFLRLADFNAYMDAQQTINLEIYRRFEAERIEFAYPTQTVFLASEVTPAVTRSSAPPSTPTRSPGPTTR